MSIIQDEFLALGSPVFAFDFPGNVQDASGFSRHGTLSGSGSSYASNGPDVDNTYLQLNGAGYVTLPASAAVGGNASRTLIALVRMTDASFVTGSQLIYMGGGDNGSSTSFMAFGLGPVLSATASKRLRLDWTRAVNDVNLPARFIDTWTLLALTHSSSSEQKLYAGIEGDTAMTTLLTTGRTLNTQVADSNYRGNWIGQWNNVRRFVGGIGFVGMTSQVLSPTQLDDFLNTIWRRYQAAGIVRSGSPAVPVSRKVAILKLSNMGQFGSIVDSDPVTGEYVTEGGYSGPVVGISFVDYGNPWAASTVYTLGARSWIRLVSGEGHWFEVEQAGTSDTTEPTWPLDGSTVVDGTVIWRHKGLMERPWAEGPYLPQPV